MLTRPVSIANVTALNNLLVADVSNILGDLSLNVTNVSAGVMAPVTANVATVAATVGDVSANVSDITATVMAPVSANVANITSLANVGAIAVGDVLSNNSVGDILGGDILGGGLFGGLPLGLLDGLLNVEAGGNVNVIAGILGSL
jgi:hypothetical protein